jgi:hypothetical protein
MSNVNTSYVVPGTWMTRQPLRLNPQDMCEVLLMTIEGGLVGLSTPASAGQSAPCEGSRGKRVIGAIEQGAIAMT